MLQAEPGLAATPLIPIGEWLFSPSANELCRGVTRRKLEHRAARVLELLCRRRGSIVSHEEIVREVWNGRAISANSVPVVISDLRQALGDDAREPHHIETIAKRGYRLLADGEAAPPLPEAARARWRRSRAAIALAAVLLAAAIVLLVIGRGPARPTPLVVTDVVNATGSARWRPLASATSEALVANAQRIEGVELFRGRDAPPGAGAITLSARLIIWSGRPTVMISAQDGKGAVIWTGMTSGREDLIPREIAIGTDELSARLASGRR